ncbi:cellulose-binding domain-containing protein, partial [Actinoplanes subtropicus]|uniref:cellulose-binding domain-containing protein n=1 Tax=Actinoplanes subtropicus TaxID=543632 RepID=UPI001B80C9D2
MVTKRVRRVLAGLLAAGLGTTLAATTLTAHAAASGCQVSYTVSSQWQGGFGASVAITNLGDPIDGWTLRWSFGAGQTVSQAWNATVTQSGAAVTAVSMSYNAALATGASTSFGFNGGWTGSNPVPTAFTLNGVACTGSTTTTPPTTTPTTPPTTSPTTPPATPPTTAPPATSLQGLPAVDPNGCHNSGLPRAYGTNFKTPADPYGQGFSNQTALGWDGNYWPAFGYLSGS